MNNVIYLFIIANIYANTLVIDILSIPIEAKIFNYNNFNIEKDNPISINSGFYFPSNRFIPGNVSYGYASSLNNTVQDFSISYSFDSNIPLLIGFNRQIVKDIFDTSSAWNDNGDGIPYYSEINYNNISRENFETSIVSIGTQYSKSNTIFGVNAKIFRQSFLSYSSIGISSDIGINHIYKLLNIHIGIKNLLNYNKWDEGEGELFTPMPFLGNKLNLNNINLGMYLIYQKNYSSLVLSSAIELSENLKIDLLYSTSKAYSLSISFINEYLEFSLSTKLYHNGFINDNINFSFGILPGKFKNKGVQLVP